MNAVRPSKLLLTTDFSESASCAYPYAVALAKRSRSELVLLHVMTGCSEYLESNDVAMSCMETIQNEVTTRMAGLDLGEKDGIVVRREITRAWSAAEGIVSCAEAEQPNLIVLSTHGHRPLAQLVVGSVARRVTGMAPCPVLCVKRDVSGMLDESRTKVLLKRILVPIDLSNHSREALALAAEYSRIYGAQLHIMYVLHVDIPPRVLSEDHAQEIGIDDEVLSHIAGKLQAFQREIDPIVDKVATMIEKGPPAKKIAHYAEAHEVDLVIMGRKGVGDTPHLIGGVVERLLHDAHCPVLVV